MSNNNAQFLKHKWRFYRLCSTRERYGVLPHREYNGTFFWEIHHAPTMALAASILWHCGEYL